MPRPSAMTTRLALWVLKSDDENEFFWLECVTNYLSVCLRESSSGFILGQRGNSHRLTLTSVSHMITFTCPCQSNLPKIYTQIQKDLQINYPDPNRPLYNLKAGTPCWDPHHVKVGSHGTCKIADHNWTKPKYYLMWMLKNMIPGQKNKIQLAQIRKLTLIHRKEIVEIKLYAIIFLM